jgi:hypothetical protein
VGEPNRANEAEVAQIGGHIMSTIRDSIPGPLAQIDRDERGQRFCKP